MSHTAAAVVATRYERDPFIDARSAIKRGATLHADTVDVDNTPTTQLRPGLVVGERSDGKFIDADDASVQAETAPAVDSLEAPDGGWTGAVVTASIPALGIDVSVTLGTIANVGDAVTDLNDDEGFSAHFVASADTVLVITARYLGVRMVVTSDFADAYGAGGVASTGTQTEYGILFTRVDSTRDIDDTVRDKRATLVTANAKVDTSKLTSLTTAARRVLARNGIIFA